MRKFTAVLSIFLMLALLAPAIAEQTGGESAADAEAAEQVLAALNEPLYTSIYEYLISGGFIEKGENSDYGRGLQTLLVALGKDIEIDGQVGKKTIAAMNEVREALGMEANDGIGAPCFERLLICLLCTRDEDAAYDILVGGGMTEDEFYYIRACGLLLSGGNYQAYLAFGMSSWENASERADGCVLDWPSNGELYRNESYSGKTTRLKLVIANRDEGYATFAKIYAQNGDLVSCVFIAETGSATVKIPGGTYCIKLGVGNDWFGVEDAFGDSGNYETLLFGEGVKDVELESGYEYTVTINTETRDPDNEGVGAEDEDWGDF